MASYKVLTTSGEFVIDGDTITMSTLGLSIHKGQELVFAAPLASVVCAMDATALLSDTAARPHASSR